MDGLKISSSDLRAAPEISVNKSSRDLGSGSIQKSDGAGSFADTLKDAINSVNQLQKDSDVKMQQMATGQNTNIHETMIAAEKADIALRLMVQVRNKIIEAYQEIMRMQV